MHKTATKPSELTLTSVDPRVRMKEIREDVTAYLKGKTVPQGMSHLGQMPENMADARRMIVALQDLYEKEAGKKAKASNYICNLIHLLDGLETIIQSQMTMIDSHRLEIADLRSNLEAENKYSTSLGADLYKNQCERDAVLTTMKILNVERE
jgi:hypothetical protein